MTDTETMQRNTPPGMAYWAGTGPESATCAGCVHFRGTIRRTGIGKGEQNEGRCAEYMRIMRRSTRAVPVLMIPPKTPACRHFEAKPQPAEKAA